MSSGQNEVIGEPVTTGVISLHTKSSGWEKPGNRPSKWPSSPATGGVK